MRKTSPMATLHPSNLLTYVSLAAGVCAVAAALRHSAAGAGAMLAIAALADTFDGRFARLFERSPELDAIGADLDSLSDAVTFGIAPIATIGILASQVNAPAPWWWWTAGVAYVGCTLTRLAYYNVAHASDGQIFVGLPTPVAALVWSTLLLTASGWMSLSLVAFVLGLAMIAPLRIARPSDGGLSLFALWPVGLVLAHMSRG
jgi:CDP-diacylglycerol--serine O-phosphatidyltransferase